MLDGNDAFSFLSMIGFEMICEKVRENRFTAVLQLMNEGSNFQKLSTMMQWMEALV